MDFSNTSQGIVFHYLSAVFKFDIWCHKCYTVFFKYKCYNIGDVEIACFWHYAKPCRKFKIKGTKEAIYYVR